MGRADLAVGSTRQSAATGAAPEPVAEWKPVTRHALRPKKRSAVIRQHATFQKRSNSPLRPLSPLRGSEGQERRQCPVQRQRPAPGWRESSPRAAELRCAGGEQPCRPTGHTRLPRAPRRSARPTLGRTLRRTAQRPLPRSGRDVLSNTNRSHGLLVLNIRMSSRRPAARSPMCQSRCATDRMQCGRLFRKNEFPSGDATCASRT